MQTKFIKTMKKIALLAFTLLTVTLSFAQVKSPVQWSYSSKKVAGGYEVHMVATIEKGWHIYSQTTAEGGPVPTTIEFTKNPLITLSGAAKEVGKLEKKFEPLFDVDVKQFSNKVSFVQLVKVKGAAKTNVAGTIEFMVCNDSECLPPTKQKFSVALN